MTALAADFATRFRAQARRVRARLAASKIATGASLGLAVGVGAAALGWQLRLGSLRPIVAAGLALAGALAGAWLARRRRWDDTDVALYLDRELGAEEAIATALDLPPDAPAHDAVVGRATRALGRRRGARGPRVWHRWHVAIPLGAGGIVALSLLPLPALPPPPLPPPGSELVTEADLAGLDAVQKLASLEPRDAAERERLRAIAERADALRQKLAAGMPRREALDELGKLAEAVAAERQRFGAGEERAGLEAALGKLAGDARLDAARKALGDRDLTRFDEEMAKLATELEARDRALAKKLLEEAAEAARNAQAEGVARALEEQQQRLEERGAGADALRALAQAFGDGLSPDAQKALEQMKRSGSPRAAQDLAKALAKALEGLSDAERQKLAERLRELGKAMDPNGSELMAPGPKELAEIGQALGSPEGQKELAEMLRKLAETPPPSDGEKVERGLDGAKQGLEEAERALGAVPLPTPSPARGAPQGTSGGVHPNGAGTAGPNGTPGDPNGPNGAGPASPNGTPGGPNGTPGDPGGPSGNPGGPNGPSGGEGPGEHAGHTDPVAGGELRAKVDGRLGPGAPNPGTIPGRSPGVAGETANKAGTGVLGRVGPAEVGAVENGDVPEEYREQVGRYFQPD
ncbi:MAG: hypothetical protein IT373_32895 [Polyangiaceae bacterium]|nr:hypothetical protein [Polyangiaceae bacterium]